jgi:hypothetical protein
MKKVLAIIGIVLVVLIVAVVLFAGKIIKSGVNTMGPRLAGVPVSLENAVFNPITGVVHLEGLFIGNPEGFNTPSAMELGEFKVELAMGSLFSDTLVIRKILINEPQITYEKSIRSSNLKTLQQNLASEKTEPAEPSAEEEPAKKSKPAKKVIIEDFQIKAAKVHVSLTAVGGKTLTVALPGLQMQDIGKDSGGASPSEVLARVFDAITGAAASVAAKAGDLAGDTLKGAGSMATDAAQGAADAASDAAKSATDTLKKGIGGLLGK